MAEDSQRPGREGEKIANEILKLIRWGNPFWKMNIDCRFPSWHKPTIKNHPQIGIEIF
jgi:hypothetical protein